MGSTNLHDGFWSILRHIQLLENNTLLRGSTVTLWLAPLPSLELLGSNFNCSVPKPALLDTAVHSIIKSLKRRNGLVEERDLATKNVIYIWNTNIWRIQIWHWIQCMLRWRKATNKLKQLNCEVLTDMKQKACKATSSVCPSVCLCLTLIIQKDI